MTLPSIREIATLQEYTDTLAISQRQLLEALATVSLVNSSFFHHFPVIPNYTQTFYNLSIYIFC
jgi:hypothetical protein